MHRYVVNTFSAAFCKKGKLLGLQAKFGSTFSSYKTVHAMFLFMVIHNHSKCFKCFLYFSIVLIAVLIKLNINLNFTFFVLSITVVDGKN